MANSIHDNIQVDLRTSTKTIEFLDIQVNLDNENKIHTDLYEKENDGHIYLHNTSCHPKRTKQKIAYGLGIRARRIC